MQHPETQTDEQIEYLKTIRHLFLDHTATDCPESYIEAFLPRLIPFMLNTWAVNERGIPTRPQTDKGFTQARRWSLWEHGQKTALASKYS